MPPDALTVLREYVRTHSREPIDSYGLEFTPCDCALCDEARTVLRGNCRVYWGSHGCKLPRGHEGPCECDCCVCRGEHTDQPNAEHLVCVAKAPVSVPVVVTGEPETVKTADGSERPTEVTVPVPAAGRETTPFTHVASPAR